MELEQTLPEPITGYWDGGPKQRFRWSIVSEPIKDSKGYYVRVGSWSANYWFTVAVGKTVKSTLANARRSLRASHPNSEFKYIDTEPGYFEQQLIKHIKKGD